MMYLHTCLVGFLLDVGSIWFPGESLNNIAWLLRRPSPVCAAEQSSLSMKRNHSPL